MGKDRPARVFSLVLIRVVLGPTALTFSFFRLAFAIIFLDVFVMEDIFCSCGMNEA